MLRRFLPKSLYARVALIVILPIFLMQSVITYVFFARHWDLVTANLSANVAGQIALITTRFEQAETPQEKESLINEAFETLDLSTRFESNGFIPGDDKRSLFSLYNETLDRQLDERLQQPYWFNTQSWPAYVEVRVQLDDGYLVFLPLRSRVFATTGPVFVLWLIGTSMLLGSIAIVFLRNQVRSILKLASAAEDFGRGRDAPGFRPTGATEVRRAGTAFIAMRERIKRHIDQRTKMLAGVSHDMRTPLTRMKLALAMQTQNQDVIAMQKDVTEMESMLEAYLEFASDIANTGEPERVDISELVLECVENADPDMSDTEFSSDDGLFMQARPIAVKRAVANLVSNAHKYADKIWVHAQKNETHLEIIVDDDGPGVPPEKYDELFKPFYRLDDARSQNVPGVGLGMSIVRDVARSHGGETILGQAPQGGLRVILRLPI